MKQEGKRLDAAVKAAGKAIYVDDMVLPGMVYGAVVRSPHPHAEIRSISAEKAEKEAGVLGVLTWKDIPGIIAQNLERPVLCSDRVRYIGDGVALVAAETLEAARRARRAVEVEYHLLPAVLSVEAALQPQAPLIHGESNIAGSHQVKKGDIKKGFAQAEVVVQGRLTTPRVQAMAIEPEAAVAHLSENGVTVYCPCKSPFNVRRVIAETLGVSVNKVRLIQTVMGGSFGVKDYDMSVLASRAALMAHIFHRPAKIVFTREESTEEGTKRHAYQMDYKIGATRQGELTAMEIKILSDAGAYKSKSIMVGWRSAVEAAGPYRVPNVHTESTIVYTNQVYSDAMRGFGSPQVDFACEVMMDELAEKLGIDPLELRKKNALREGDTNATAQTMENVTILECLQELERRVDFPAARAQIEEFNQIHGRRRRRGIGIAALHRGEALGAGGEGIDTAGATCHVEKDGSVKIYSGISEMGQGSHSMMVRVAGAVLGLPGSRFTVSKVDTDYVPDSGPTVASRGTVLAGNAARLAAEEIREKLAETVAEKLKVDPKELCFEKERIFPRGLPGEGVSFDEAVRLRYSQSKEVYGTGWWSAPRVTWDREKGQGDAYFSYVYGACAAMVEVDLASAKTDLLRFVAVHDVGKALDYEEVYGQICGGIQMGIGYALSEEVELKEGRIGNLNFEGYQIPTSLDMGLIEPVILEFPSRHGPLGAKGLGEPVTSIVAPAITNAISCALGERVYHLPAKLEVVSDLIEARRCKQEGKGL